MKCLFVTVFARDHIIPGLLRWCKTDLVHPQYFRASPPILVREWLLPGVMILTVSGGDQSQKMGLFPLGPPLRGDFDHGKILKP